MRINIQRSADPLTGNSWHFTVGPKPFLQCFDGAWFACGKPFGIFIVFDGLGLVAKQIEVIANSEPPRVHIISTNRRYPTYERTLDEINIIGRVIWYGRRL